jgi:hypothetical protein
LFTLKRLNNNFTPNGLFVPLKFTSLCEFLIDP